MRAARYGCVMLLLGCSTDPLREARSTPPAPRPVPAAAASEPEPGRAQTSSREQVVRDADDQHRDPLAVPGRDDRFSADRQIAALERAISLYEQFLERAGDDPHYEEAARRSRDRIADAKRTIDFLRSQ